MFSVPRSSQFSKIVLASGSPRQKEILHDKGGIKNLDIQPSTFEEESKGLFDPTKVYDYITGIALGKVLQVVISEEQKSKSDYFTSLFIGADTVVLQGGKIFEKPTDPEDALSMLTKDTKTHQVCSGVVLLVPRSHPASDGDTDKYITHTFQETSDVRFSSSSCSDEILQSYVDTGEPMDKAGGYGIQGLGAQLIEGITGDFYNVMGFPLPRFCRELDLFINKLQTLPDNMFTTE